MTRKRPGRSADATGRSNGDGKHVRHYEYMLASPAYRDLDAFQRCLLLELYRLYRGDNNGRLFLSVRTAAALLKASRMTASRAFHILIDHGFIKPRQGAGFSYKARHATEWQLTEFEHAGQPPTKEFMRWQPATILPSATILPAEIQNTVLPEGQIVPVVGQMDGTRNKRTRSGSPEGQIERKQPQICPSRRPHINNHGGKGGVASVRSSTRSERSPPLAPVLPSASSFGPANGGLYPVSNAINGVMCSYGDLLAIDIDKPRRKRC